MPSHPASTRQHVNTSTRRYGAHRARLETRARSTSGRGPADVSADVTTTYAREMVGAWRPHDRFAAPPSTAAGTWLWPLVSALPCAWSASSWICVRGPVTVPGLHGYSSASLLVSPAAMYVSFRVTVPSVLTGTADRLAFITSGPRIRVRPRRSRRVDVQFSLLRWGRFYRSKTANSAAATNMLAAGLQFTAAPTSTPTSRWS